MLPVASWLPVTLRKAAGPNEPADDDRVAAPREVFPRLKVTVPVGNAVPDAALTVTVMVVLPVGAMLAEPAVTPVVVATVGGVIVTVTEAVDPLNLLSPP